MRGGPLMLEPVQVPHYAAHAVRALRALVSRRLHAEAVALLGTEVSVEPEAYAVYGAPAALAALAQPLCAVQLDTTDDARPHALLCEVQSELAARLVDRALGGDGDPTHPIGLPLDDLSLGVLGYLASRLCAAGDAALRVAALLDERDACAALLGEGEVLCLPLRVLLDGRACGSARLLLPERTARHLLLRAADPPRAGEVLPSLPVTASAVIARTTLPLGALRALAHGDVLVPERCAWRYDPRQGWSGPVEIDAHGAATRLHASAHDRQLVIERHESRQEPEMTEAKRIKTVALSATGDTSPLGDDTPIELCLTLASFTLPLGELAALQPGDVIDTGRAVGAHVTLTASGRAVAIGELVELNGDVGLRVLELRRDAARTEQR